MTPEQEKMVLDNLGLVKTISAQFRPTRIIDAEDLYQSGCLGLVKAAIKWNPDKMKSPFCAYANASIRNAIREQLRGERCEKYCDPSDELPPFVDERLDTGMNVADRVISVDTARQLLQLCSERERRVIAARASGKTLDEIGRELGVTQERAWQIEARAKRRMAWMLRKEERFY